MTTNQSSSQPIGQSNKSPREHSHGGLPTSSSAPRSRLPGHNHSSRESIDSINPDQMLYYGAKQIIRLIFQYFLNDIDKYVEFKILCVYVHCNLDFHIKPYAFLSVHQGASIWGSSPLCFCARL